MEQIIRLMKKHEYKLRKESILEKIIALEEELKSLKVLYINANRLFNAGDRVMIAIPESKSVFSDKVFPEKVEFGYFSHDEVNYHCDIVPYIYKENKNGSQSKHRLYLNSSTASISKANNHDIHT